MTRYWSRPKRYGYGATPTTWQGWVLTFGVAAIVAGSTVAVNLLVGRSNFSVWMIWAGIIAAVTYGFVQLSLRRTEGEWRWRAENKD
jgi:hypothetical protein